MSPGNLRGSVVTKKAETVRRMLAGMGALPASSAAAFTADPLVVAAAESYLRRGLEALLDLGRHLLAKGFGIAAVEYKEIPVKLREAEVLDAGLAGTFVDMAGYRNRLTHLYDEVTPEELHGILSQRLGDVEAVLAALLVWIDRHPERLDDSL